MHFDEANYIFSSDPNQRPKLGSISGIFILKLLGQNGTT